MSNPLAEDSSGFGFTIDLADVFLQLSEHTHRSRLERWR
jgi:hypothetical protein